MHTLDNTPWQHEQKSIEDDTSGERNTRWAVILTAIMMVAEIVAGLRYNSME